MQTVALIIGLFVLGWLARQAIHDVGTAVKWLNSYIINLAWPAVILLKIPGLALSPEVLLPAGFAWAWALLGGGLMLLLGRLLNFSRPLIGATILLTVLGNTSFFGYPMVLAYFNDTVLGYAIFYDQLGSFLLLSTVGLTLIAIYAPGESGQTISAAGIVKRIFTFPPFIALLLSISLPIELWLNPVQPVFNVLGQTLMPVALFVIGLQFQPQLLPEHRLPLMITITSKMALAPILVFLGFNVIDALSNQASNTALVQATVFQAAMPCMITPGILAIQAGLSPRFCATLLGYSTLFSLIWIPLVAGLL